MILRYVLHMKSRFNMNIIQKATVLLILILFCIILGVSHYYTTEEVSLKQIELDDERRLRIIAQDGTERTFYLKYRIKEITRDKYRVKYVKNIITLINDRQHIGHVKKLNATKLLKALDSYKKFTNQKLDTVLVVQVHGDHRDLLAVLLESLSRVTGIHECLLIFAHDYYDPKVYNMLNDVHFTRVLQIFYPYSVQLHPHIFPGDDLKFCPEINKCIDSNERDPIQSQKKHFWWWTINEVFEHVEILKKYGGYIYFLEVDHYLTTDFILMAKTLEKKRPSLCSECKILSLAAKPPRAELYRRVNSSLIISIWGWSKTRYISSGIGLNRTTWNEIKDLKEEFCYFNDYTWENSLKHLASRSHQKAFHMLSVEGSRIFTHSDAVKLIRTIAHGLFPYKFRLVSEEMERSNNTNVVEESGGWNDARDRELCIFMASHGRLVYYQ